MGQSQSYGVLTEKVLAATAKRSASVLYDTDRDGQAVNETYRAAVASSDIALVLVVNGIVLVVVLPQGLAEKKRPVFSDSPYILEEKTPALDRDDGHFLLAVDTQTMDVVRCTPVIYALDKDKYCYERVYSAEKGAFGQSLLYGEEIYCNARLTAFSAKLEVFAPFGAPRVSIARGLDDLYTNVRECKVMNESLFVFGDTQIALPHEFRCERALVVGLL